SSTGEVRTALLVSLWRYWCHCCSASDATELAGVIAKNTPRRMTTGVRRRRLTVPVWHGRSEGKGGTLRTSGYRVDVASTRPLGAFHTLHEMGGGAPRAVRGATKRIRPPAPTPTTFGVLKHLSPKPAPP